MTEEIRGIFDENCTKEWRKGKQYEHEQANGVTKECTCKKPF